MTNSTGFTPAITRYLNSVKGKKRQELVNQISQLSSKDLEQLEMNLIQKYEDESEMESINKMGKQAYMDLYDMNEGQYEKRFGGRMYQQGGVQRDATSVVNMFIPSKIDPFKQVISNLEKNSYNGFNQWNTQMWGSTDNFEKVSDLPQGYTHVRRYGITSDGKSVPVDMIRRPSDGAYMTFTNGSRLKELDRYRFQDGGAYYGGDDSADYLEQVYNQQAQTNQPQPMISPTGIVITPEMQQDLMMQNQVVPVNGFRPNQQTYTPQEAASLYQQGLIQRPANYVEQVAVQSPVVYHVDPNKANQTDKAVAKEAEKVLSEREGVKRIQEELYNRGLLKGDKSKVIDGIFGKKTEAAVKAVQEQLGLKSDGIVGAKTKVALGITDLGRNTYKSNIAKQVEEVRKRRIGDLPQEGQNPGKLGSPFKGLSAPTTYNDNLDDLIQNKKGDYSEQIINPIKQVKYASAADFGNRGFYEMPKEQQQEMTEYANIIVSSMIPIGGVIGLGKTGLLKVSPKLLTQLSKYGDDVIKYAKKLDPRELKAIRQGLTENQYVEKMIELSKSVSNKAKEGLKKGVNAVRDKYQTMKQGYTNNYADDVAEYLNSQKGIPRPTQSEVNKTMDEIMKLGKNTKSN